MFDEEAWPYRQYTAKERAETGKYACNHGAYAAACLFSLKLGVRPIRYGSGLLDEPHPVCNYPVEPLCDYQSCQDLSIDLLVGNLTALGAVSSGSFSTPSLIMFPNISSNSSSTGACTLKIFRKHFTSRNYFTRKIFMWSISNAKISQSTVQLLLLYLFLQQQKWYCMSTDGIAYISISPLLPQTCM